MLYLGPVEAFLYENLALVIAVLAMLAWFIHALYFFSPLWKWKKTGAKITAVEGVSVIIAARNEAENLTKYLPLWLQQKAANFEVIVVDDRSWDGTYDLVSELQEQYPNLVVSQVKEQGNFAYSKKFALMLGIKKAQYDCFLFTDADCFPNHPEVVAEVAKSFMAGNTLVLGYSPLQQVSGVLAGIQSLEHTYTAIQYYGFAMRNMPYMGVGRFLGYTRALYEKVGGFKAHYHLPYGDDDLFVQQAAPWAKTAVIHPKFAVCTQPKKTLHNWINQRKRHYSASQAYLWRYKLLLAVPYLTNIIGYTALGLSGWFHNNYKQVLYVLVARLLLGAVVGVCTTKKFGKWAAGLFMPFWEIIIFIIQPLLYLAARVNPTHRW